MVRRQLLRVAFQLADLFIMAVAFLLADALAGGGVSIRHLLALRIRVGNVFVLLVLFAAWYLIFRLAGAYRHDRLSPWIVEARRALLAASCGALAVLNGAFLFHLHPATPMFAVAFWFAAALLCVASRGGSRWVLTYARRGGRNLRNVLIVGTNTRAVDYAAQVEARTDLGYRVIGFVDDEWSGLGEFRRTGRKVVAAPERLVEFLRVQVVDEVVIGLPLGSSYPRCAEIIALCEEQGIVVRILSDHFHMKLAKTTVEVFDDKPLVTLWTGTMEGGATYLKRLLDLALSFTLIVLLAPLFAVVALLVKLTSPGPVLFVQQRIGYNKRRIKVYKFRSMAADAETRIGELEHLNEISGPVFKIKNDPRLTPIGRFLRQTSIDELPQLFSVLRGDMSLVGPRPLPLRDYQGFKEDWHRRRLSVRPGITCLWQVNGRSSLPFDRWMELDMQYIDHWSLLLDIKILARTIPAVLRGTGAA